MESPKLLDAVSFGCLEGEYVLYFCDDDKGLRKANIALSFILRRSLLIVVLTGLWVMISSRFVMEELVKVWKGERLLLIHCFIDKEMASQNIKQL